MEKANADTIFKVHQTKKSPLKNQVLMSKPIVFHADLSDAHEGEDYFLAYRGERIKMAPHTEETLAAAFGDASHQLPSEKRKNVTHFADGAVFMAADTVTRVHLRHTMKTFEGSHGTEGVSHSAIFIPPGREHVASCNSAVLHAGPIDYTSTAKSLLFHHPDLVTQDLSAAQTIHDLMDTANIATLINSLALQMRQMGPPTETSGWARLVPFVNPDEQENYDPQTKGTYRQHPADEIQAASFKPLAPLLIASNNNKDLQGKKWLVQNGQAVASNDGDEQLRKFASFKLERGRVVTGDKWNATLANSEKIHSLQYGIKVTDADKNQVEVTFSNYGFRYLGLYVRFFDAHGKEMSLPDWKPDDSSISRDLIIDIFDNQYDDMRFLGFVSPMNSVMAIPLPPPGETSTMFKFPSGAVSASLYGSGLGTGADLWPKAPAFGGIMTAVFNLGVPTFFLGFGVAAQTYKPLYDILQKLSSNKIFLAAASILIAAYIGGTSAANRSFNWSAATSVVKFLFDKACTKALVWVETELAEGELEDEIPFAGWIMLAINIAATLAQLAETIVLIATSPWNIENKLALSITSTITIHPDPRHKVFPQGENRKYVVKMIFKNQNRPTMSYHHNLADGAADPALAAIFDNNTLGGEVKVEADFYVGDWLAGKATTGWLDNNETVMAAIDLYLVEFPVPLSASSIYQHEQILIYKNGGYSWNVDKTAPTSTIGNRNTGPSGNAFGDWRGITLSQRKAMVGFSWQAAGMGISQCGSGSGNGSGQLNAFENIAIPGSSDMEETFPGCGFAGKSRLIYDTFPPKFLMKNGNWVIGSDGNPEPDPNDKDLGNYYIDPRPASLSPDQGGGYHLRKIVLDASTPFNMNAVQPSYGRFPLFPDSIALHPSGHVIGVNSVTKKMMVAALVENGAADIDVPMAAFSAGPALDAARPGLMFYPVSVSCAYDGTILVLEDTASDSAAGGEQVARISAFDLDMNPVQRFFDGNGKPAYWLYLTDAGRANYLDMQTVGDEHMTYMYVLYYTGTGLNANDYKMSIYTYSTAAPASNPLVTTPNTSVAALAVDMWHSVYTQNFEMVTDGNGTPAGPKNSDTGPDGRTVPSVSLWLPPVP